MAGFRKAKREQSALKMGIYGPPGSGKTFSTLLFAEGLAKRDNKRIAFVDTEEGTVFYAQKVEKRAIHPEAFDFDVLPTRSITEVSDAVKSIKPENYSVIVIDSMTHIWEACRQAYTGKTTRADTIPMHAWAKIKKPYKDLIQFLLNCPMHVFILGRQGVEYDTDEDTGDMKAVGLKMKAEGETPYEPHILLRMEIIKSKKTNELAKYVAYAEKDRTGVLAGRSFVNPTFDSVILPLLPLLGIKQDAMPDSDIAAQKDAERLQEMDEDLKRTSENYLREFKAKIDLAANQTELGKVGKEISAEVKSQMTTADVATLKAHYHDRQVALKE